ncbi:hypothetical protein T484DRAFT_1880731, partial [Baffinella frigidus]
MSSFQVKLAASFDWLCRTFKYIRQRMNPNDKEQSGGVNMVVTMEHVQSLFGILGIPALEFPDMEDLFEEANMYLMHNGEDHSPIMNHITHFNTSGQFGPNFQTSGKFGTHFQSSGKFITAARLVGVEDHTVLQAKTAQVSVGALLAGSNLFRQTILKMHIDDMLVRVTRTQLNDFFSEAQ